jgi:hypothetical protein
VVSFRSVAMAPGTLLPQRTDRNLSRLYSLHFAGSLHTNRTGGGLPCEATRRPVLAIASPNGREATSLLDQPAPQRDRHQVHARLRVQCRLRRTEQRHHLDRRSPVRLGDHPERQTVRKVADDGQLFGGEDTLVRSVAHTG